jgi:sarcosine oxidase, subunit gamma
MTAGLRARSPLEGVDLPARVRELPFLAQVDVRADPSDAALLGRLRSALDAELPLDPNTTSISADGSRHVLWLGPDEWLVLGEPGTGPSIEAGLRDAMAGGRGAVVDVSANRTTLSISGPRARDLLAFGCSIDLDARSFGPGRCVQTMLARANVIIAPVGPADEPAFRVLVRPSFAAYVADWLNDAVIGLD